MFRAWGPRGLCIRTHRPPRTTTGRRFWERDDAANKRKAATELEGKVRRHGETCPGGPRFGEGPGVCKRLPRRTPTGPRFWERDGADIKKEATSELEGKLRRVGETRRGSSQIGEAPVLGAWGPRGPCALTCRTPRTTTGPRFWRRNDTSKKKESGHEAGGESSKALRNPPLGAPVLRGPRAWALGSHGYWGT